MWYLLVQLMLLFMALISFCNGMISFSIVQCDVSCSKDDTFYNSTYILIDGTIKKLTTPIDTLCSINPNFSLDDVIKIPLNILSKLKLGKEIAALKRKSFSPDDVVLFELSLTHALQDYEPLLLSKQVICEGCKNPSITLLNNQALLVYESRLKPRNLNYFWINTPDYPLKNAQYLGVDQYTPWKDSQSMIQGADARLVAFNDEILYLAVENPVFQMSYASLIKKGNLIQSSSTIHICPDTNPNIKHKNWTPFIFNSSLYLLQTLNPLHVVTLEISPEGNSYLAKTVSITHSSSLQWSYGEMRGGSNAVHIGNNEYLAFFHSRYSINFNTLITYVFGAYTFSSSPIFKLTGVSKFPIYIDSFHQGEWFNKYFDYVVYPTSLFINSTDEEGSVVYLTVGHNDLTGYLLKFTLTSVLKSLIALI